MNVTQLKKENKKKDLLFNEYNPTSINNNFENYIFENKLIDILENKFIFKDPNFNVLTKQIISNENWKSSISHTLKNEIESIKLNKSLEQFKLKYLTIKLIGQTGTGKSFLINNLLYDGENIAKENIGDIWTLDTTHYQSKTVSNLRLVYTRGIELPNAYDIDFVSIKATQFINHQRQKNNVHLILDCIDSVRFKKLEKNLVDNLMNSINFFKLSIIVVLTKTEIIRDMKNYIYEKHFYDNIEVLVKRIICYDWNIDKRHGLDELVDMAIKKCEAGFDGLIKEVLTKNLTIYINNNLSQRNPEIREIITLKMLKILLEKI